MYSDISRAYFNAPAAEYRYIGLPEEDARKEDGNNCARLKVAMYGTRDAAHEREVTYTEALRKMGFKQGISSPCVFWHEKTGSEASGTW